MDEDPRIAKLRTLLAELANPELAVKEWRKFLARNFDLTGCVFPDLRLNSANFSEFTLNNAKFVRTQLSHANFVRATLDGASFDNVEAEGAHFQDTKLNKATLTGGNLTAARFQRAELEGARFEGPDLSRTVFDQCNLKNAVLLPRKVDAGTSFTNMKSVEGCEIERLTLESLGSGYGGLTAGDRARMKIRDDVALLRYSYSGFWQWIHLLALLIFAFPYAWFVVKAWGTAKFLADGKQTISLLEAIGRFILTGGDGWREGWNVKWPFAVFLFALFYNILRAVLLMKTKQLELQQTASGVPALFSVRGKKNLWAWLYQGARWGFWINLVVVGLNTLHFLTMRIPIE